MSKAQKIFSYETKKLQTTADKRHEIVYYNNKNKQETFDVLIMSKRKQHSKQFKLDAIQYRTEHPDLGLVECARNLGIGALSH